MIAKKAQSWLLLWTICSMMTTLPVISNWLKNQTQVYAQDLILPIILSLLTSLIISLIFAKRFYKNRFAPLIGAIAVAAFFSQNYQNTLSKINPGFNSNAVLGIVFSLSVCIIVVFLGLLMCILIEKYTFSLGQKILVFSRSLIIIISIAFGIQLISALVIISNSWSEYFYRPPQLNFSDQKSSITPDIYYIVLDRYASQDVLKEQFQFDNYEFLNYLSSNDFFTDPSALSNYPYTAMSVSATLGADYQTDLVRKFSELKRQTSAPYYDSIKYSPVISKLKDLGYSYDFLGSWFEATNQAPLADNVYQPEGRLTVFGRTFTLNGFPKISLMDSFWEQIVRHGVSIKNTTIIKYSGISEADATEYKLDRLRKLANQPAGGRFIFAHILVPHDPYYFSADGSRNKNSESNNTGEPIKQKYIGQVKYINAQMKEILSLIEQKGNRQSVVILQSDEGPYPAQLNDKLSGVSIDDELSTTDMRTWSDLDLKMKYGILAAYKLPMANKDELWTAGDSVNIFRLIFNTYFGANLPYLPRCYYALPNGKNKPFVYAKINNRLTGQPGSECPENSNFSGK